jgi:hypothetical protein
MEVHEAMHVLGKRRIAVALTRASGTFWQTTIRHATGLLIAVLALVLPDSARAVAIYSEFSGAIDTIVDIHNAIDPSVEVGTPFIGWFIYDSDAPDSSPAYPDRTTAFLDSAPYGLSIQVGTYDLETIAAPDSRLFVSAYKFADRDQFAVNSPTTEAGVSDGSLLFRLIDPTRQALAPDAFPPTTPSLADWSIREIQIRLDLDSGERIYMFGTVQSIVPEPATAHLLLLGLVVTALMRRPTRR